MPLYSFKCNKCGVEFDRKQSLEEFDSGVLPENENCPNNNKECEVKRVISPLKAISTSWKSWRT